MTSVNLSLALICYMITAKAKDSGTPYVVIIASAATYSGAAISATKVAVVAFVDSLRAELALQNIGGVSTIASGVVKTRIVKR
jgi:short-subunit dehydrogenase